MNKYNETINELKNLLEEENKNIGTKEKKKIIGALLKLLSNCDMLFETNNQLQRLNLKLEKEIKHIDFVISELLVDESKCNISKEDCLQDIRNFLNNKMYDLKKKGLIDGKL